MKTIFHITKTSDWEKAKYDGVYKAPSLDKDGFIHCSLAHQIPPVANFNFKGQQELVLLEIAQGKLTHDVKFEDLYGEGKDYPHLYGPLNLDAVLRVFPFPPKEDGTFVLPGELAE
ncbi:hypothetical protein D3C87_1830140 [compost metagenome]